MKRCSKCGEWKEESEFDKCSKIKSGYRNPCKACRSLERFDPVKKEKRHEYDSKRYAKNRDEIIKKSTEWQKNNPERSNAKKRKWENEHYEIFLIGQKKYRERVGYKILKDRVYKSRNKKHEYYLKQAREYQRIPENVARFYFLDCGLDNPPQELIDLKAEQIRLFRAVRDKRMGVQEHEG